MQKAISPLIFRDFCTGDLRTILFFDQYFCPKYSNNGHFGAYISLGRIFAPKLRKFGQKAILLTTVIL